MLGEFGLSVLSGIDMAIDLFTLQMTLATPQCIYVAKFFCEINISQQQILEFLKACF